MITKISTTAGIPDKLSALLVIFCRHHNGQVWQNLCHRYLHTYIFISEYTESLLSPLVSGVAGVLAIVLGVCLKWAILPPVVDSMVRWDNIQFISILAIILIKSTKGIPSLASWNIFWKLNLFSRSKLRLDPTNEETWEAWVSPPITPFMKFNFFRVLVMSSMSTLCHFSNQLWSKKLYKTLII